MLQIVLFNLLVFSKFYAAFYDLSSLIGNFYSYSVDIIVSTFVGRLMQLMHVYFMQSRYFFVGKYFLSADENSNIDIGAI